MNYADVFISYSRHDRPFVENLNQQLQADGRVTWTDWQDIPEGADWWDEIKAAILRASTFVFVISPASAESVACRKEIEYAETHNKHIVPVLYQDAPDFEQLPAIIRRQNWIFFNGADDHETASGKLIDALQTDLAHVRGHTRYLVRAEQWDTRQRDPGYLLTGMEAIQAQTWLENSPGKEPAPSPLHHDYIAASYAPVQERLQTGRTRVEDIQHWLRALLAYLLASLAMLAYLAMTFRAFGDDESVLSIGSFVSRGLTAGLIPALIVLGVETVIPRLARARSLQGIISLLYATGLAALFWVFFGNPHFRARTALDGPPNVLSIIVGALALGGGYSLHKVLRLRASRAWLITMLLVAGSLLFSHLLVSDPALMATLPVPEALVSETRALLDLRFEIVEVVGPITLSLLFGGLLALGAHGVNLYQEQSSSGQNGQADQDERALVLYQRSPQSLVAGLIINSGYFLVVFAGWVGSYAFTTGGLYYTGESGMLLHSLALAIVMAGLITWARADRPGLAQRLLISVVLGTASGFLIWLQQPNPGYPVYPIDMAYAGAALLAGAGIGLTLTLHIIWEGRGWLLAVLTLLALVLPMAAGHVLTDAPLLHDTVSRWGPIHEVVLTLLVVMAPVALGLSAPGLLADLRALRGWWQRRRGLDVEVIVR